MGAKDQFAIYNAYFSQGNFYNINVYVGLYCIENIKRPFKYIITKYKVSRRSLWVFRYVRLVIK